MSSRNEEPHSKKERRRSNSRLQLEENVFTTQISHYHQTMGYYAGLAPPFVPDRTCYNNINWSPRAPPWTGWPPPGGWLNHSVTNGNVLSPQQSYPCRVTNRVPPPSFNLPSVTQPHSSLVDPILGSVHPTTPANLRGWYTRYPNDIPLPELPVVMPPTQLENIDCLHPVGNHIHADLNFIEKTVVQKCETTTSVCGGSVTRRSWYKMPEKSPPPQTKKEKLTKDNEKTGNLGGVESTVPNKPNNFENPAIITNDFNCTKLSTSNSSKSSNCLPDSVTSSNSSNNFAEYFLKRLMKKHQNESKLNKSSKTTSSESVISDILTTNSNPKNHIQVTSSSQSTLSHLPKKHHIMALNSSFSKRNHHIIEDVIDLSRDTDSSPSPPPPPPPPPPSLPPPALIVTTPTISAPPTVSAPNLSAPSVSAPSALARPRSSVVEKANHQNDEPPCDLVITSSYSLSLSGVPHRSKDLIAATGACNVTKKRRLPDIINVSLEDNQKENLLSTDIVQDYRLKLESRSKRKKYEPRKRENLELDEDTSCWPPESMNKLLGNNYESSTKNYIPASITNKSLGANQTDKFFDKTNSSNNAPEYCDIVDILHSLSNSSSNQSPVETNDKIWKCWPEERQVERRTNNRHVKSVNNEKCVTLDDTDDSDGVQAGETMAPKSVIHSRQSVDTLSTAESSMDSLKNTSINSKATENNDSFGERTLEKEIVFTIMEDKVSPGIQPFSPLSKVSVLKENSNSTNSSLDKSINTSKLLTDANPDVEITNSSWMKIKQKEFESCKSPVKLQDDQQKSDVESTEKEDLSQLVSSDESSINSTVCLLPSPDRSPSTNFTNDEISSIKSDFKTLPEASAVYAPYYPVKPSTNDSCQRRKGQSLLEKALLACENELATSKKLVSVSNETGNNSVITKNCQGVTGKSQDRMETEKVENKKEETENKEKDCARTAGNSKYWKQKNQFNIFLKEKHILDESFCPRSETEKPNSVQHLKPYNNNNNNTDGDDSGGDVDDCDGCGGADDGGCGGADDGGCDGSHKTNPKLPVEEKTSDKLIVLKDVKEDVWTARTPPGIMTAVVSSQLGEEEGSQLSQQQQKQPNLRQLQKQQQTQEELQELKTKLQQEQQQQLPQQQQSPELQQPQPPQLKQSPQQQQQQSPPPPPKPQQQQSPPPPPPPKPQQQQQHEQEQQPNEIVVGSCLTEIAPKKLDNVAAGDIFQLINNEKQVKDNDKQDQVTVVHQSEMNFLNLSKKICVIEELEDLNKAPCLEVSENGDINIVAIVTDYEEPVSDNLSNLTKSEHLLKDAVHANVIVCPVTESCSMELAENETSVDVSDGCKSSVMSTPEEPMQTDNDNILSKEESAKTSVVVPSDLLDKSSKEVVTKTKNGEIVSVGSCDFINEIICDSSVGEPLLKPVNSNSRPTTKSNWCNSLFPLPSCEVKLCKTITDFKTLYSDKITKTLYSDKKNEKHKDVKSQGILNSLSLVAKPQQRKFKWSKQVRKSRLLKKFYTNFNKRTKCVNKKSFQEAKSSEDIKENHIEPLFLENQLSPGNPFQSPLPLKYDLQTLHNRILMNCPVRYGRVFTSPDLIHHGDPSSFHDKQIQTDINFTGCVTHAFSGSCYSQVSNTPPHSIIHKFVKFHGHKLLCVVINVKKYVIVREVVQKCFLGKNQIVFYRTKYRDYSLPYLELPHYMRSFALKYLLESSLVFNGNRATPLGIMLLSDAELLYHFFYSFKECKLVKCVQDWDPDNTGVFDPKWSEGLGEKTEQNTFVSARENPVQSLHKTGYRCSCLCQQSPAESGSLTKLECCNLYRKPPKRPVSGIFEPSAESFKYNADMETDLHNSLTLYGTLKTCLSHKDSTEHPIPDKCPSSVNLETNVLRSSLSLNCSNGIFTSPSDGIQTSSSLPGLCDSVPLSNYENTPLHKTKLNSEQPDRQTDSDSDQNKAVSLNSPSPDKELVLGGMTQLSNRVVRFIEHNGERHFLLSDVNPSWISSTVFDKLLYHNIAVQKCSLSQSSFLLKLNDSLPHVETDDMLLVADNVLPQLKKCLAGSENANSLCSAVSLPP
ncbi:uncharacterized protein LOC118762189 isoform X2 [Octopus sinensis]|uniref:Uncharacterized protein LOC118762189 isoform X2 n=1 Tax=Octopus sinensis TaxID=2607531 RepID=A0A7E6EP92_9MOLL|nr:uncharacterized protein LOC118762189 isoform X2 [Octopus sinensis]